MVVTQGWPTWSAPRPRADLARSPRRSAASGSKTAPAENRTRVWSVARTYATTIPLVRCTKPQTTPLKHPIRPRAPIFLCITSSSRGPCACSRQRCAQRRVGDRSRLGHLRACMWMREVDSQKQQATAIYEQADWEPKGLSAPPPPQPPRPTSIPTQSHPAPRPWSRARRLQVADVRA